nr:hypothetical protein SETIT_4G271900v2 [Ipomoea trifida]
MGDDHETFSLSSRKKKSFSFSVNLSCCFHRRRSLSSSVAPMSPSRWIKSRRNCRRQRCYCSSTDFTYDPLSYARNFDDHHTSNPRDNFLTREHETTMSYSNPTFIAQQCNKAQIFKLTEADNDNAFSVEDKLTSSNPILSSTIKPNSSNTSSITLQCSKDVINELQLSRDASGASSNNDTELSTCPHFPYMLIKAD